jgi:nucleoside-diphosphate-sugar epimerase
LKYMQAYAETKAMAEMEVSSACDENFMTVSVVPHQVYGPRNNLFLPNLLFDVVPPPEDVWRHPNVEWRIGDITDASAVDNLLSIPGIKCVWHNAAAVGC